MRKLALLALVLTASAAPAQPAPKPAAPKSLWVDWKTLARDSVAAEAKGAKPDVSRERELQAEADARGKLVGELVTSGDCANGERIAREAGDFALVRAARDYCAAKIR